MNNTNNKSGRKIKSKQKNNFKIKKEIGVFKMKPFAFKTFNKVK